jgi:hypothetical protein
MELAVRFPINFLNSLRNLFEIDVMNILRAVKNTYKKIIILHRYWYLQVFALQLICQVLEC